jgi:uncharacterized protein
VEGSHLADRGPTVTVTGRAVLRAEPDEAVLWVTLSALTDAPGAALSDVSERSQALVALLDRLGVEPADRSTTGVTVYEEFEHTKAGRRSLGHRAMSRVSVRVTDPGVIGRLITEATENLAAQIDGPRWLVSPGNPIRLEAARQAAADARRRAQAYAEGVGAQLGRVLRLADPDQHHFAARAAGAMEPMAAAAPMPIEPGESDVAAVVEATFTLEAD